MYSNSLPSLKVRVLSPAMVMVRNSKSKHESCKNPKKFYALLPILHPKIISPINPFLYIFKALDYPEAHFF